MTLQRVQGLSGLDTRFDDRLRTFRAHLSDLSKRQAHFPVGIRATLIPTRSGIFIDRPNKNPDVIPVYDQFHLTYGDRSYPLLLPTEPPRPRPVLGGVRYQGGFEHLVIVQEVHRDGLIEMTEASFSPEADDAGVVYPETVLAITLNAVLTAYRIRTAAGAPDTEYALEVEISRLGVPLTLARFGGNHWEKIGAVQPMDPRLPRLKVGPAEELQGVIRAVATDLLNAAGSDIEFEPFTVEVPDEYLG